MHELRKLVFVAIFCVGYGAYLLVRLAAGGGLVEVDLERVERGHATIPSGMHFRVNGATPRWDLSVRGDTNDTDHRVLVPVVSATWSPARPVVVFLEVLDRDSPPDQATLAGTVTGVRVTGRGIGRHFRRLLAERDLRDADDALILTANRTPVNVASEAAVWIGAGCAMLLIYRLLPSRWKNAPE